MDKEVIGKANHNYIIIVNIVVSLYDLELGKMLNSKKIEQVKSFLAQNKKSLKPRSIVLKLGTDCNLRCIYCYVEHKFQGEVLKTEIVEKLFDELMENNKNIVNCCFHGGEPLFYFEKMKEIVQMLALKSYNNQIRYSCQSNGTLLTDDIVDFIEKYRIAIGISLDGPQKVNDLLRVYPNGVGSHEMIMKGIQKLQKRNIAFSILSVITDYNVDYVVETLAFLKEQGITSVDFKPYFKSDLNDQSLSPTSYANAMIKAIEWMVENNRDKSQILVREIEVYTNLILRKYKMEECYDCRSMCDVLNCGAGRDHITVDVDGKIYLCDRLYGHKDYVLGNISQEPLERILENPLIKIFLSRRISDINECKECEENQICFLGCPATNILYYGNDKNMIWQKPPYCEYYYRIIKRLRRAVEQGEYFRLIEQREEM